jgi:SAM-dependent methyltransferase
LEKQAKDLFSKQSKEYAAARPTYPRALFDYVLGLVEQRKVAWDCATGNGQAAVVLSDYFEQVVASDISAKQLENAQRRDNIRYEIFPAENTPLREDSIDLVTVAQALHWFDFDRFYSEVNMVLRKKSGVLAAWAYGLHSVSPEVDAITHELYEDVLGSYWPVEREYLEAKYETLPFPFDQFIVPEFRIELELDSMSLINYIYTWSSVQKFIEKNNRDPVKEFAPLIQEAWGEKDQRRKVVWPLYVKVGRPLP